MNKNAPSVGDDEHIAREKLLQMFMSGSNTTGNLLMLVFEDFTGDLCDAYMEYSTTIV